MASYADATKRRKKVSFEHNPDRTRALQDRPSFTINTEKLATALFPEDTYDSGWNTHLEITTLDAADCDLNRSSTCPKKYPNILKKREQSAADPIKDLPFSPSRFLNSKATTSFADITSVSKDLNLSFGCYEDDSGIENASYEASGGVLTAPSLTSTPICKSRRKRSDPDSGDHDICSPVKQPCSFQGVSNSDIFELSSYHKQLLTIDSLDNETVFKTPVIHRYLSESGPRTPTPFKCDLNDSEKKLEREAMKSLDADSSVRFSHSEGREPSFHTIDQSEPVRAGGKSLRKARKALMLGPECSRFDIDGMDSSPKHDAPLATRLHENFKTNPVGFIPFGSPPRCQIRSPSCLIGGGAIVRQRSFNCGKKSCFYTLHSGAANTSKQNDMKWKASEELNKKWVTIACGRSEDQKAMTNAAKKYLIRCKSTIKKIPSTEGILKGISKPYGNSIR